MLRYYDSIASAGLGFIASFSTWNLKGNEVKDLLLQISVAFASFLLIEIYKFFKTKIFRK